MDREKLDTLLQGLLARAPEASEINLTPGRLPHLDVHGELRAVPLGGRTDPLTPAEVAQVAAALVGERARLRQTLEDSGSCDVAYTLPDGRRFRVNVFRARGNLAVVMRQLPGEVPGLDALGLPEILGEIPCLRDGLVLVTGATGSGKSTTLAAIVDRVNESRAVHVVTLEDPIEFTHPHKRAIVNQRELLLDFPDFKDGLRAALRQAPKVILVGEIRDPETVEIALKAAETGHLVLSTLHTINAGQTINRIVGMFGPQERPLVRSRLAETLRFVVGQRLLPKSGGGRVPAIEVMGSSLRIRDLILHDEQGEKTYQAAIADARAYGWQTFDQHVIELFGAGAIDEETARSYCTDASSVGVAVDRIKAQRGEDTSDIGDLEMATPKRDDFSEQCGYVRGPGRRA